MERVHIDYLGPLPKTNKDNEHLLMMVYQFTKWVKVIPVASQTTELTAQTLVLFGVYFKVWISVSDILRPGAELCEQVDCHIMCATTNKTSSPMDNDRSPWSQHNVWRHHNLRCPKADNSEHETVTRS